MLESWDEEFFVYLCRHVDEDIILSYIKQIKSPYISYTDEWCQNVLHIAASHGRTKTCQSLLESISPEETDFYRWTPLHRAIYNGHFGTALLFQQETLYNKIDSEGYSPLDLLALDNLDASSSTSMLFSWGTNVNYSLGLGSKESKLSPEIHEFYRKNRVIPKKVQINTYHSGVLGTNGSVYLAGYGSGGRLGNGKDCTPYLLPQSAFPQNEVLDFALGRDHSIFLVKTNVKNLIYVTGSNSQKQLGVKGDLTVFSPKSLTKSFNETIIGVGASTYYSCCWSTNTLYAWGLNVGQMGFQLDENDPCVDNPRLIFSLTNEMTIRQVYTSDCSIIILTQNNKLILLRDSDIRRLHVPLKSVKKVQLIEEYCLKTQKCITSLKVYILSEEGKLYSWSLETGLFRCMPLAEDRNILLKDFFVSQENIFIVSSDTQFLYKSSTDIYGAPPKKSSKQESCRRFKVSRIPKANKVQSIMSDNKGLNFFISCSCSNTEHITKSSKDSLRQDRLSLDEYDSFKDGTVIVKSKRFDVHIALLNRESPQIANEILQSVDFTYVLKELDDENDAEDIFQKMINMCYEETPGELLKNKRFMRLAKKCGFFGGTAKRKNKLFTNRSCKVAPDAYLISSDGKKFPIHRIVLCQKSEYFSAMFRFGAWSESQINASIKLQIDAKILRAIIDFLYCDIVPHNLIEDAEDISNLIIIANQFFISKLAFVCEDLLIKSIHLRNALKVFQFAIDFSLPSVSNSAMHFICLNMGYFFESGRLGSLDEEYIDELCNFYRYKYFPESRQKSRNLQRFQMNPLPESVAHDYYGEHFIHCELQTSSSNNVCSDKFKKKKKTPSKKKAQRKKEKSETEVPQDEPEVLEFSLENERDEEEKGDEEQDEGLFFHDEDEVHEVESKKLSRWVRKSQRERKNAERKSIVPPPTSQWTGWKVSEMESDEIFTILSPSKDYSLDKKSPPDTKMSRVSKSSWRSLSFTDDEENAFKPCPWIPSPTSSSLEITSDISFKNILKDEKKKAVATDRIKRKSLRITQIEDKAIEDLLGFYGADLLSDETIFVERSVDTTQLGLAPVWLKQK